MKPIHALLVAVALSLATPNLLAASAHADLIASIRVDGVFAAGTNTPASAEILGSRDVLPFDNLSFGTGTTSASGSTAINPGVEVQIGEELSIEWRVMADATSPDGTAFIGDDPFLTLEVLNTSDGPIDVVFVLESTLSGSAQIEPSGADIQASADAFAFGVVDDSFAFDFGGFAVSDVINPDPVSFLETSGQVEITATLDPQQMVFADIVGGVTASADALIPVPPALWLFGSALAGLGRLRHRSV